MYSVTLTVNILLLNWLSTCLFSSRISSSFLNIYFYRSWWWCYCHWRESLFLLIIVVVVHLLHFHYLLPCQWLGFWEKVSAKRWIHWCKLHVLLQRSQKWINVGWSLLAVLLFLLQKYTQVQCLFFYWRLHEILFNVVFLRFKYIIFHKI